jgi:hypothetical protein
VGLAQTLILAILVVAVLAHLPLVEEKGAMVRVVVVAIAILVVVVQVHQLMAVVAVLVCLG